VRRGCRRWSTDGWDAKRAVKGDTWFISSTGFLYWGGSAKDIEKEGGTLAKVFTTSAVGFSDKKTLKSDIESFLVGANRAGKRLEIAAITLLTV
jgi:hypothetical protein